MRNALIIALFSITAAAGSAQPTRLGISFSGTAVNVSGVPPGHDVLVFSVARESHQYHATVVQRVQVLNGAPGGPPLTWDIGQPIPLKSVWCAVDLQTGEFEIKTPERFDLQRMLDGPSFPRDGEGDLVSLVHERAEAVVLLVTPGRGAWLLRTGDGGNDDEDARAGKARIRFDKLPSRVKNGPLAPRRLTPNDTVIVIDPIYLDVWSGRVGREVQP